MFVNVIDFFFYKVLMTESTWHSLEEKTITINFKWYTSLEMNAFPTRTSFYIITAVNNK